MSCSGKIVMIVSDTNHTTTHSLRAVLAEDVIIIENHFDFMQNDKEPSIPALKRVAAISHVIMPAESPMEFYYNKHKGRKGRSKY